MGPLMFFCFTMLAVFVLLNMFIAIIRCVVGVCVVGVSLWRAVLCVLRRLCCGGRLGAGVGVPAFDCACCVCYPVGDACSDAFTETKAELEQMEDVGVDTIGKAVARVIFNDGMYDTGALVALWLVWVRGGCVRLVWAFLLWFCVVFLVSHCVLVGACVRAAAWVGMVVFPCAATAFRGWVFEFSTWRSELNDAWQGWRTKWA